MNCHLRVLNHAAYSIAFLILIFFIFLSRFELKAQDTKIFPSYHNEEIEFSSMKDVKKDVSISSCNETSSYYFISYESFNRFKIKDFLIYDKKKEKFVHRKPYWQVYTSPGDEFYSSDRVVSVNIPEKTPFQLNYEITSENAILTKDLLFSSGIPADTFSYKLTVPEKLSLKYKVNYSEMISSLCIDSVYKDNSWTYSFKGTSLCKKEEPEPPQNIQKRFCFINLIITPEEYKNKESLYFNNWFFDQITTNSNLNEKGKQIIDSVTRNYLIPDSIAKALFDYVRSNIKYIDIENGLGAFIPNDVNKIIETKQGDCKDKAELLCAALRYKGIKSEMVLVSTFGTSKKLDFPSANNGNHMINRIKTGADWIYLDPTENIGEYGHTGLATQGRNGFALNAEGGCFVKIPVYPADKNTENIFFDLRLVNDSIRGFITLKYSGIAKQQIQMFLSDIPKKERSVYLKTILKRNFRNIFFDKVDMTETSDTISIYAETSIGTHLFTKLNGINYLSLDFLPYPIEIIKENPIPGDLILFYARQKIVKVDLQLDRPVLLLNTIDTVFNDSIFNFSIKMSSEQNHLFVRYIFRNDEPVIRKESNDKYHEFINFITKTFTNAIRMQ